MKRKVVPFYLLSAVICLWARGPASAEDKDASLMKSTALQSGGKISNTEKNLYQDSIQATKQSIARDTLDAFYHDALDYYSNRQYDEALQLLDKIYSIDPHYQDVASLRNTVRKTMQNSQAETAADSARDWLRKGDTAMRSGQKVLAISYWKQALVINPGYTPAKKKILEVNQALAKKEFESGYLHYHHGELEDAMESWSNAIALDPTYKQRGLLLLMSKVDLQVRKDQTRRLAAQGFDQEQEGHHEDALQSYQELLVLEPRNEEARRMTAKIKNQLGSAALKAARDARAKRAYTEAIRLADQAVRYGYEVSRATQVKKEAELAMQRASRPAPKPPKKVPAAAVHVSSPTETAAAEPPVNTQPANPEEALVHYRQGMAAIRKKDFHLAVDELTVASQLDPSNERIYMARERARQEWTASSAAGGGTP